MLLPGTDVMNIVRQDKLQAHVQATLSLAAALLLLPVAKQYVPTRAMHGWLYMAAHCGKLLRLLFALLSTPMNQGVQRWHDGWRTRVVHVSYP